MGEERETTDHITSHAHEAKRHRHLVHSLHPDSDIKISLLKFQDFFIEGCCGCRHVG